MCIVNSNYEGFSFKIWNYRYFDGFPVSVEVELPRNGREPFLSEAAAKAKKTEADAKTAEAAVKKAKVARKRMELEQERAAIDRATAIKDGSYSMWQAYLEAMEARDVVGQRQKNMNEKTTAVQPTA